jgi:membrane protease subunit HflC
MESDKKTQNDKKKKMSVGKKIGIGVACAAGILAIANSVYIVPERNHAVVTQFGKPVQVVIDSNRAEESKSMLEEAIKEYEAKYGTKIAVSEGAGIYFKIPFIQNVDEYSAKVLEYDSDPRVAITTDKKEIMINNYARFVIIDPLKFKLSVKTLGGIQSRLDDIVYSVINEVVGRNNRIEIIRTTNSPLETTEQETHEEVTYGREKIMQEITQEVNNRMQKYGIEVLDVRFRGVELPQQNEQSIMDRMRAERQRIAMKYRSEGQEESAKIKAEADKQVAIINADAYKKSQEIKGTADAEAAKIYAEVANKDPEFYELVRSLEAYKKTLKEGTTIIINTDSEFLKYLTNP